MDFHGDRTQILDKGVATNATVVIYTVPANKKFHLISALTTSNGGAVGDVEAVIRNDSDVVQKQIGFIHVGAAALNCPGCPFDPGFAPVLEAGWDLAIISSVALLEGGLNIFGLEVDE